MGVSQWEAASASAIPASTRWEGAISSDNVDAVKPTKSECADLLFVGVRGSDERDANGKSRTFGATVQRVRDNLRTGLNAAGSTIKVRQVYVNYTAAAATELAGELALGTPILDTQWYHGANLGISEAERVLKGSLKYCPKERWYASGYSQGSIISDALEADFDRPSKWVGDFSVANVDYYHGREQQGLGAAYGKGHKPEGIFAKHVGKAPTPSDLRAVSFDYAARHDGMADYSKINFAAELQDGFKIHGGYKTSNDLKLKAQADGRRVARLELTAHHVDARAYRVLHTTGIYASSLYQFSSPSGNVRCQVGALEDSSPFSCVATKHTWKAPKLPVLSQNCKRLSGAIYALDIGMGFYSVCKGTDPRMTHRGKVLRAGKTISVLGVTCTSLSSDGMRCFAPHETGLTMTRTHVRVLQPAGWRG